MKKLPSIPFAVLYLVLSAAAHGQTNVKVDSVPAVGKDVTVEYTLPLARDQRIQWSIGDLGTIDGDATQTKVKVKPSGPGDIAVSCTVIPPNPDSRTGGCGTTLHVPGNGGAQAATGATGAAGSVNSVAPGSSEPTHPQATTSTASQVSPGGDLDIITEGFTPSGYQGDGQQEGGLSVDEAAPGPQNGTSTKIIYSPPSKSIGWAALSWLAPNSDPAKPWGITPGQNYAGNGFASFRLLARASRNGTVQFKSGDSTASARDVIPATYQVTLPFVKLTGQFREYCIPLQGRNLANVFSPLTVVFTQASNPGGAEIYVADMRFSQTRC